MNQFLLAWAAVFLCSVPSWSQSDVSGFGIRHYTSENGLPQSTVKSITADEYGFIWLATESGLLRFDGTGFKLYNKNNTGIMSSRMSDIWHSPDGKMLLARNSADEMLLISGGTAKKYPLDAYETLYIGPAKSLRHKHSLWGPKSYGSDHFFLPLNEHLAIVVTIGNGIFWYSDQAPVRHTPLPSLKKFADLFVIGTSLYYSPRLADGVLDRITPEGIRKVRFTGDFLQCPDKEKNTDIETNVATGQTFLYAGRYLYTVSPLPDGNLETRLLLSGFDLTGHWIYCTYYDRVHERLFLGSLNEGLFVLDRKKFHTVLYDDIKPGINNFYDHIPLNDSCILTGNGPILCSNPAVKRSYNKLLSDYRHYFTFVFRSADSSIMACLPDGVYRLSSDGSRVTGNWPCAFSRSLAENRDGRLWIGTGEGGLFTLDLRREGAKPELFTTTGGRIMGMACEEDTLWVCALRHVLRIDMRSGKIDTVSALTDKMARSVYVREAGEVWLCTYEDGLYLWLRGKLTHFPGRSYPYLNTVHKILEDNNGFFWISTNQGLYQMQRTDLLRYAEKGGEEPYGYYYSKESGFLTNEFNGGSQNVGAKLVNGFFTFASMNGVVFFKPSEVRPELPGGPILIDKVEVDGREVPFGGGPVRLKRNFRTLSITPVSAYMGNPANLKYEFRLSDNDDWQSMQNGRIVFSSLPSGHSRISIRKRTGFGTEGYEHCRFEIYVVPAWWETRWFYTGGAIGLVLLVGLIIRLRVRYWKRRNKALEAAVQDRTRDLKDIIHQLEHSERRLGEQLQFQRILNGNIAHDINTPLKYLTIFTNDMLSRARKQELPGLFDVEHVHEATSQIYEVVQGLNHYMQLRLSNNISRTSFNLYEIVRRKAELFSIAADKRNDHFENQVSPDLFINQSESLISIVLHNLIDNAIKNTEDGRVIFEADRDRNGTVLLRVMDTGRGMTPAMLEACNEYFSLEQPVVSRPQRGFGFLIIKEISLLLKLEIKVERMPEEGTCFRVLIPEGSAAAE